MTETVVCVGAVVRRGDKFLLVRQSKGHSLEGQWTIPWGRLGRGESPAVAALRETLEESGVVAEIEGLLGVQELPPPWDGQIAILYLCSHVEGEPTPDFHETDAAKYFDRDGIEGLYELAEPFSAWLVRRILRGKYTLVNSDESNPFYPSVGYV